MYLLLVQINDTYEKYNHTPVAAFIIGLDQVIWTR